IQGWVSDTRSGTDRRSSTATNATTAAAVTVARTATTVATPATCAAANEDPPMGRVWSQPGPTGSVTATQPEPSDVHLDARNGVEPRHDGEHRRPGDTDERRDPRAPLPGDQGREGEHRPEAPRQARVDQPGAPRRRRRGRRVPRGQAAEGRQGLGPRRGRGPRVAPTADRHPRPLLR